MAAEQPADVEPPGDPIATPREIGERPGIMTMDIAGGDLTPRAAGFRVCRRDQEGELRMRVVDVPAVQLEWCRVGQNMRKRVSRLHGS